MNMAQRMQMASHLIDRHKIITLIQYSRLSGSMFSGPKGRLWIGGPVLTSKVPSKPGVFCDHFN